MRRETIPYMALCTVAVWALPASASSLPHAHDGFTVRSLDATVDLLSGMAETPRGIVVCDRGAGRLLLVPNNGPVQTFIEGLETPVDVMPLGGEWLVLQEVPGTLLAIDRQTDERRLIAEGLAHPTAFTLDLRGHAYVVEFDSGALIRVDLRSGDLEFVDIVFDKPADILFAPPDRLIVAEQVGFEGRDGAVSTVDTTGRIVDRFTRIVDPSGLALEPNGEILATTFRTTGPNGPGGMGGVIRIGRHHMPDTVVTGLVGPTSLVREMDGGLVVLEETTDSIYRYPHHGGRVPLLEGFSPIHAAASFPNGDLAAIERGPRERLRVQHGDEGHQTWAEPRFGNWAQASLAISGLGNVYLSDPFPSVIHVYDRSGNLLRDQVGLVPFLMAGIPTGGVVAFSHRGNEVLMFRLDPDGATFVAPLRLNPRPVGAFVTGSGEITIGLEEGEILQLSSEGAIRQRMGPVRPGMFLKSIAPAPSGSGDIWALDGTTGEVLLLHPDGAFVLAARAESEGVLLPHPAGVLYISLQGKRFVVARTPTPVADWLHY